MTLVGAVLAGVATVVVVTNVSRTAGVRAVGTGAGAALVHVIATYNTVNTLPHTIFQPELTFQLENP